MASSFSETRAKIQRCKVKAIIIAMTKKSQYCPGEQQEKTIEIKLKNLSKLNEIIKAQRRSILKNKDYCSDETERNLQRNSTLCTT